MYILVDQSQGNFRSKTLSGMKIRYVSGMQNDALKHRGGLKG